MIVRAVLQNPATINAFDFYNDYDNTSAWLKRMVLFEQGQGRTGAEAQAVLDRLTDEYDKWLVAYLERQSKL